MQMEPFLYLYNVLQNIFVFLDFLVDYSILCFSEYLMTNFLCSLTIHVYIRRWLLRNFKFISLN